MTEQQLADYTPKTASGAALKERLEAASQQDAETPCESRRTVIR
jgi:hypothetical protein